MPCLRRLAYGGWLSGLRRWYGHTGVERTRLALFALQRHRWAKDQNHLSTRKKISATIIPLLLWRPVPVTSTREANGA